MLSTSRHSGTSSGTPIRYPCRTTGEKFDTARSCEPSCAYRRKAKTLSSAASASTQAKPSGTVSRSHRAGAAVYVRFRSRTRVRTPWWSPDAGYEESSSHQSGP